MQQPTAHLSHSLYKVSKTGIPNASHSNTHLVPHQTKTLSPHSSQVLVTDPKELEAIRQRESDITKERVQKILDAGKHPVQCDIFSGFWGVGRV